MSSLVTAVVGGIIDAVGVGAAGVGAAAAVAGEATLDAGIGIAGAVAGEATLGAGLVEGTATGLLALDGAAGAGVAGAGIAGGSGLLSSLGGAGSIVSGLGSLAGGYMQGQSAIDAANISAGASEYAAQLQYQMFLDTMNMPQNVAFQQQAPGAINTLAGGYNMDQFQSSPAYQSMLGANNLLLQNAPAQYAATGMLGSGNMQSSLQQQAQLNALSAEGQGYNQWYQPLSAIAGMGQAQAASMTSASGQTANSMGSYIQSAGNAQAAGVLGQSNAWSNAMSGMNQNYYNSMMMNQLSQQNALMSQYYSS